MTGEVVTSAQLASGGRVNLLAVLEHALELLEAIDGLDIRSFEQSSGSELASTLCPLVLDWLRRAQDVVAEAQKTRGDVASDRVQNHAALSFELQIDSLMVLESDAYGLVCDIACVAQLELSQRFRQLSQLPAGALQPELLDQCDSALRRIKKSISALEDAVSTVLGRPSANHFASELAVSLRVRAAYAKLRLRLLAEGEPNTDSLHRRMRAAGTQIAMLVGSEIYPSLRMRDRLQLRSLQGRILDWLRDPERDFVPGLRLWQDLESFVRMLALVNKRQELLAHDEACIAKVSKLLQDGLNDCAWRELEPLRGLDDELDAMLDNRAAVEPGYLIDLLEGLRLGFGGSQGTDWR